MLPRVNNYGRAQCNDHYTIAEFAAVAPTKPLDMKPSLASPAIHFLGRGKSEQGDDITEE